MKPGNFYANKIKCYKIRDVLRSTRSFTSLDNNVVFCIFFYDNRIFVQKETIEGHLRVSDGQCMS